MTVVDWLLVVAIILFALAGWHRGFVTGVLSFVGFLGGGLLAAFLLPPILEAVIPATVARVVLIVLAVVLCAVVGQLLASFVGARMRGLIAWHPARLVDNPLGGAVLNVAALAVVLWIVASAVAYLPSSPVAQQVSDSRVLVAIDSLVPSQARNAFGSLRDLVGTTAVPRIFSGLDWADGPEVDPPDDASVTAEVRDARASVVRVIGSAVVCERSVGGSGFVVLPERVLTNAHVVAGVTEPMVQVRASDPPLPARVVHFDPVIDVAVLEVPGLRAPALPIDMTLVPSGTPAVAAGFPSLGPFVAQPARIRTNVTAQGDDIYGRAGAVREVYVVRTHVEPGSSGGPLLSTDADVLGMVFGADPNDDTTAYALTASDLEAALTAAATETTTADTGSCRIRD